MLLLIFFLVDFIGNVNMKSFNNFDNNNNNSTTFIAPEVKEKKYTSFLFYYF
jgi:hypothetical protein